MHLQKVNSKAAFNDGEPKQATPASQAHFSRAAGQAQQALQPPPAAYPSLAGVHPQFDQPNSTTPRAQSVPAGAQPIQQLSPTAGGAPLVLSTEVQADPSATKNTTTHEQDDHQSTVTSQRSRSQTPGGTPHAQGSAPMQGQGLSQALGPVWAQAPVPHQPGPAVSITKHLPQREFVPFPPHLLQGISSFLNGTAQAQIPVSSLHSSSVPPALANALAVAHDSSFRLEAGTHDFAGLLNDAVWRVFPSSPEVCFAMVQVLLGATASCSKLCAFHARYAGLPPGVPPAITISPALVALFSPMGPPPVPLVSTGAGFTVRSLTPNSKAWGRPEGTQSSPTTPVSVPHNYISEQFMDERSLQVRKSAGEQSVSDQAQLLHVCSIFKQAMAPQPNGSGGMVVPFASFSARETVSTFWNTWSAVPSVDGVFSVIERVVPLAPPTAAGNSLKQGQVQGHHGTAPQAGHTQSSSSASPSVSDGPPTATSQTAVHLSESSRPANTSRVSVRIPVPNAMLMGEPLQQPQHSSQSAASEPKQMANSAAGTPGASPTESGTQSAPTTSAYNNPVAQNPAERAASNVPPPLSTSQQTGGMGAPPGHGQSPPSGVAAVPASNGSKALVQLPATTVATGARASAPSAAAATAALKHALPSLVPSTAGARLAGGIPSIGETASEVGRHWGVQMAAYGVPAAGHTAVPNAFFTSSSTSDSGPSAQFWGMQPAFATPGNNAVPIAHSSAPSAVVVPLVPLPGQETQDGSNETSGTI